MNKNVLFDHGRKVRTINNLYVYRTYVFNG